MSSPRVNGSKGKLVPFNGNALGTPMEPVAAKPKRGRKGKRWWMVYLGSEPIWTVDAPTEEEALARASEVTNRPVTVRECVK
jgi:hypothetical protein